MCLEISTHFHSRLQPKVAQFPILVWKGLDKRSRYYESPYRYKRYYFEVLYTATMYRNTTFNEIEDGLHACITEGRARWHSNTGHIFPAIIPEGSLFWLSRANDNEIVSNQLIVYRNLDDVKAAFGGVEIASPVKRNTL